MGTSLIQLGLHCFKMELCLNKRIILWTEIIVRIIGSTRILLCHHIHISGKCELLDRSGVKRWEAGDTVYDMQCAAGAGVDFALALWGAHSLNDIDAKYKCNDPNDIIKLIK